MPVKANKHLAIGLGYERLALNYLRQSGLVFIQKNIRYRFGELDLVMRDNETIVFIEVKYRATNTFGGALSSVTYQKQQRLEKAALAWLAEHNRSDMEPCRFDLVAITGKNCNLQFQWLKNIFQ